MLSVLFFALTVALQLSISDAGLANSNEGEFLCLLVGSLRGAFRWPLFDPGVAGTSAVHISPATVADVKPAARIVTTGESGSGATATFSYPVAKHQQTHRPSFLLSPCPCSGREPGHFCNCKGVNDTPASFQRQPCLTRTALSLLVVQPWRHLILARVGPTVGATGPWEQPWCTTDHKNPTAALIFVHNKLFHSASTPAEPTSTGETASLLHCL